MSGSYHCYYMSEIQKKKKDQIHSIFVCGPKKLKDSDQPEHAGGTVLWQK